MRMVVKIIKKIIEARIIVEVIIIGSDNSWQ